jgi:hypothetical protein
VIDRVREIGWTGIVGNTELGSSPRRRRALRCPICFEAPRLDADLLLPNAKRAGATR